MTRHSPHVKTFVVIFACKHSAFYDSPCPAIDEIIYCRKCGKWQVVTATEVEYRIKCRNCNYGRPFGTAQINAEISASKHRQKKKDHIVDIFLGDQLLKTFGLTQRARQLTIENAELPPF